MEVAREREGRRRKRRAIEAVVVVVVVVVMGFGILLKRRDCVLGCSFSGLFWCFFWCFFDYPCFLLSIAVVVLAVVVVSSISSCITSSSRMYVVEPVREGHCGIVCSIEL